MCRLYKKKVIKALRVVCRKGENAVVFIYDNPFVHKRTVCFCPFILCLIFFLVSIEINTYFCMNKFDLSIKSLVK
ncbi:MAG: hypothetical protein B6D64_04390 [Bacteroidetes bacterium 4484_276]|nr:MAG: hypothetical protein B6D64_04390 [Bacteroidetes bacterium 4484_276]